MNAREALRNRIRRIQRNKPFTPKSFHGEFSRSVIDKALAELEAAQVITRVEPGLYVRPVRHERLGILLPSPETLATAKAQLNGERIEVHGAEAVRQFGISTQVPMQPTYYTTGRSRTVTMRGKPVVFKHLKEAYLRKAGTPVGRAIVALMHLGKEQATPERVTRILEQLSPAERRSLLKELAQLPRWMRDVIPPEQDKPTYAPSEHPQRRPDPASGNL